MRFTSGVAQMPDVNLKSEGVYRVTLCHVLQISLVQSVRVWRGLRYNKEYAAKLAKQLAKRKAEPEKSDQKVGVKPNPFSVSVARR